MSTETQKNGFRYVGIGFTALIGVLALAIIVSSIVHVPYVIYHQGSAQPLHPRIETDSKVAEKGSFLFTTVSTLSQPSYMSVLLARLDHRKEVQSQQKATNGAVNLSAYQNLLAWMRDNSEANALIAAYAAMKRPLDVKEQGALVYSFLPETKARDNGLQEGDIITSVDGHKTDKVEELSSYLSGKKPGDKVKLSGNRGKGTFNVTIPLVKLSSGKTGVGFTNQTVLKVTPPDKIKFDFEDTGGPSAGLMMTLELITQLQKEDLTKGYKIAGTGTIAADGSVGLIGGIRYKLMAADKEKVDYFLVPYTRVAADNWISNQKIDTKESINAVLNGFGNWNEAQNAVADLKLNVKLVPVASLQDALDFLNGLKPKTATASPSSSASPAA